MTNIDNIFTSTLTPSQKRAGVIFGKLLIKLRQDSKIRLKGLMDAVSDSDMQGNVILLTVSDRNSYEMLNNRTDMNTVNEVLASIEDGVTVSYKLVEKKTYNQYRFEQYLRETFGKIVTIKK